MPKTMKTLFCNICLIYDCGHHSLEENTKEVYFPLILETVSVSIS